MKALLKSTIRVLAKRLFLLGVLASPLLLQPSLADELVNVTDMKDCRPITATAERLVCYDTVVDGGVFNQQELEQVQKENFGNAKAEQDISVDRVIVTIVKVQEGASRIHYFHTADGAVWKQTNSGSWNLKGPFQAEIKSGIMSSFFLVAEGGKSTRVKRVR